MPQEDEPIKVKEFMEFVPPGATGYPVDFGAFGKVVKLLGVNWQVFNVQFDEQQYMFTALSSDPDHKNNPPGSANLHYQNKSLYARQTMGSNQVGIGDRSNWYHNIWMPLHGLVRPARQVQVFWSVHGSPIPVTLEYYYQEIELTPVLQQDLNLVYGKHRRPK